MACIKGVSRVALLVNCSLLHSCDVVATARGEDDPLFLSVREKFLGAKQRKVLPRVMSGLLHWREGRIVVLKLIN